MLRIGLLSACFTLASLFASAVQVVLPQPSGDSSSNFTAQLPENYALSFLNTSPFIYDRVLSPFQFDSLSWKNAGDFRFASTAFDPQLNRLLFVPELDTHFAASNLRILLGSTREQLVLLDHSQHITKTLSGSVHYHSIVSPGFLLNCLSVHRSFSLGLTFNPRWIISSVDFRYGKVEADENGGIADSVNIDGLSRSDFEQLKTQATDEVRKLRQYHFSASNFIPVFRNDSSGLRTGVVLGFDWFKWSTSYAGIGEKNLYDHFYVDSSATADTAGFNELRYAGGLQMMKSRKGLDWMVSTGIRLHDHLKWRVLDSSAVFRYSAPFAEASLKTKVFDFSLKGNLVLSNWKNDGDYSVDVLAGWRSKSSILSGLKFNVRLASLAAPLTAMYYRSNHFQWDNDFDKEKYLGIVAAALFFKEHLTVSASSTAVDKMIYYDAGARPVQYGGIAHINSLNVHGKIHWRRWTTVFLARTTAVDVTFLKIPEFNGLLRVSYTARYFKRALLAEFGASLYGTSKYKGYAYMPATSAFYVQNQQDCGGWPVLDLFVNAGIGRATLSLSYQRFNSIFMNGDYFIAAGYPGAPSTIKFGVNWPLFN